MTAKFVAFLSPLALAIGFPFLLACRPRLSLKFAGLWILAATALQAGRGAASMLALFLYLTAWCAFLWATFEGARRSGLGPLGGQILCGLVATAMVASMFLSDIFIQASEHPQQLVPLFARLEPMVAISDAIGAGDISRYTRMYRISRLQDYGQVYDPWWEAAIRLVLLGGGALALGRSIELIRGRDAA